MNNNKPKGVGATTTFFKIKAIKKSWRLIQGGQGAGKNWAIAQRLLEHASEKKRVITVVSDTFENLKDGVMLDYRNMFSMSGLDFDDYYNASTKELKWGESIIQFRYVVGHKPEAGKSKRRNILYINETTKVSFAAAEHYIARTSEICYFDLNPDMEGWTHTEIEPDPRCEKIIVTYKDNEFCPKGERDFIEARKYDFEGNITPWFKVYGLGETGTYSDRRIYQFNIVDELPQGIKRIPSGMDFGISPDPTALVDLYIDGHRLYIDEVFVTNNLMPEAIRGAERMSISDKMLEVGFKKGWKIGCDNAGAVEIRDLKKHGYNAVGVEKGSGSVKEGIKAMKNYEINVTRRSLNTIKGFESWFWKVDHNGKIVPEPMGHEPDCLAASRYGIRANIESSKAYTRFRP